MKICWEESGKINNSGGESKAIVKNREFYRYEHSVALVKLTS